MKPESASGLVELESRRVQKKCEVLLLKKAVIQREGHLEMHGASRPWRDWRFATPRGALADDPSLDFLHACDTSILQAAAASGYPVHPSKQ
jgi:hypothetical protein